MCGLTMFLRMIHMPLKESWSVRAVLFKGAGKRWVQTLWWKTPLPMTFTAMGSWSAKPAMFGFSTTWCTTLASARPIVAAAHPTAYGSGIATTVWYKGMSLLRTIVGRLKMGEILISTITAARTLCSTTMGTILLAIALPSSGLAARPPLGAYFVTTFAQTMRATRPMLPKAIFTFPRGMAAPLTGLKFTTTHFIGILLMMPRSFEPTTFSFRDLCRASL